MSRLQGFSLRRKDLGPGAAFCGPHRGDAQGSGCPLCRHLAQGGARHLYETLYCARGNAENLIKLHKSQLASDRTSCRDPKANQFRLILHTAAYWLLLTMRVAAPSRSPFRYAEFNTLPSSDQDRRARGGRRGSHPCLLAHRLSRPRCLPRTRRTALRRRAIANAARSPQPTPRRNFQPSKIKPSRRVISLRRDRCATPLAQNPAAGRAKLLFWV